MKLGANSEFSQAAVLTCRTTEACHEGADRGQSPLMAHCDGSLPLQTPLGRCSAVCVYTEHNTVFTAKEGRGGGGGGGGGGGEWGAGRLSGSVGLCGIDPLPRVFFPPWRLMLTNRGVITWLCSVWPRWVIDYYFYIYMQTEFCTNVRIPLHRRGSRSGVLELVKSVICSSTCLSISLNPSLSVFVCLSVSPSLSHWAFQSWQ